MNSPEISTVYRCARIVRYTVDLKATIKIKIGCFILISRTVLFKLVEQWTSPALAMGTSRLGSTQLCQF